MEAGKFVCLFLCLALSGCLCLCFCLALGGLKLGNLFVCVCVFVFVLVLGGWKLGSLFVFVFVLVFVFLFGVGWMEAGKFVGSCQERESEQPLCFSREGQSWKMTQK